jgi:hypothetical protein
MNRLLVKLLALFNILFALLIVVGVAAYLHIVDGLTNYSISKTLGMQGAVAGALVGVVAAVLVCGLLALALTVAGDLWTMSKSLTKLTALMEGIKGLDWPRNGNVEALKPPPLPPPLEKTNS